MWLSVLETDLCPLTAKNGLSAAVTVSYYPRVPYQIVPFYKLILGAAA